jgi:hypothetical protein
MSAAVPRLDREEVPLVVTDASCAVGLRAGQFLSLKGLIDGRLRFPYLLLCYSSPAGSAPGHHRFCILSRAGF